METNEVFFKTEDALRKYAEDNEMDLFNHLDGYKTVNGNMIPSLGEVKCGCGTTTGRYTTNKDGIPFSLILCEACYNNIAYFERGH